LRDDALRDRAPHGLPFDARRRPSSQGDRAPSGLPRRSCAFWTAPRGLELYPDSSKLQDMFLSPGRTFPAFGSPRRGPQGPPFLKPSWRTLPSCSADLDDLWADALRDRAPLGLPFDGTVAPRHRGIVRLRDCPGSPRAEHRTFQTFQNILSFGRIFRPSETSGVAPWPMFLGIVLDPVLCSSGPRPRRHAHTSAVPADFLKVAAYLTGRADRDSLYYRVS